VGLVGIRSEGEGALYCANVILSVLQHEYHSEIVHVGRGMQHRLLHPSLCLNSNLPHQMGTTLLASVALAEGPNDCITCGEDCTSVQVREAESTRGIHEGREAIASGQTLLGR
jgi:hypothetical protein